MLKYLVACFCVFWFVPVTSLGYLLGASVAVGITLIRFPVLALAFLALTFSPRRTNDPAESSFGNIFVPVIPFLVVLLLASVFGIDPAYSLIRFVGVALIVAICGPLIYATPMMEFRTYLFKSILWLCIAVTGASIFWEILDIPKPQIYFKEGFPGLMSHSMLFGAIAGLSAVWLTKLFAVRRSSVLAAGILLACIACYLSASRLAIASTVVGMIAVACTKLNSRIFNTMTILTLLVISIIGADNIRSGALELLSTNFGVETEWQDQLRAKADLNSREDLWNARLLEFSMAPLFGLGLGNEFSGDSTKWIDDQGIATSDLYGAAGKVEPGSSYLAVLSNTGLVGAVSLLFLFSKVIRDLWRFWIYIPLGQRMEVVGVLAFFGVHGIGEGWVYSPGSLLCVIFWLALGIGHDATVLARRRRYDGAKETSLASS